MAKKAMDDMSIAELEERLAVLDAAMSEQREVKEGAIAKLREQARIRDGITEVLERKRAVDRATSGRPAQVIGGDS